LKTLPVKRGMWIAEMQAADRLPSMAYYQKIYDPTFSFELGVLEVKVRPDIMTDFFNSVAQRPNRNIVLYRNGEVLYRDLNIDLPDPQLDAILQRVQRGDDHFYWRKHKLFINAIAIQGLPFRIMLINGVDGAFSHIRERTVGFAGVLVGLLALLSLVYYLIVSTLTKRIIRLAKHMRKVDQDHLREYEGRVDKDEIGLLTASYNMMIRRIDDLLNRVHRAELMKKEADYQVLQAQIKPHFLYNTLESIRMLAEINDDEEVVEAIYTFGRLLRYSLSSGGNDTPLAEEIDNVRHYLQVHKIRMEDKLNYAFRIETDLSDIRCPRFILQPLVENCIVHGLGKSRRGGNIDVHVCREEDRIRIAIADNGGGVPSERLETIRGVLEKRLNKNMLQTTGSGMGLYNVSERIKAYFGADSVFRIDSGPNEGTRYTIIFRPGRNSDAEPDDRG
jgi:two-component system sensor histidine kinase YesM